MTHNGSPARSRVGSASPLPAAQFAAAHRLADVLIARAHPGVPREQAAAALLRALLADDECVRSRLQAVRAEYGDLLAAARAAVAEERDAARGHARCLLHRRRRPDPWWLVRGLLAERGQLPPDGAHAPQLLADARGTAALTGAMPS